jgi:hypothetical protein
MQSGAENSRPGSLPQSAVVKLEERAANHGYPFTTGALLWWRVYASQTAWYYALLPLMLLGIYAAFRNKLHNQPYVLILGWSLLYFTGASLSAGSFTWYYAPLIPAFCILIAWGIESLATFIRLLLAHLPVIRAPDRILRTGVLAILTSGIIMFQVSSWTKGWVTHQGQVIDSRYAQYREVAEWLNSHADERDTVAASEIGILGYYTDLRIIDLLGLVTPELTPWLSYGSTETAKKAIELYAPDYLLNTSTDDYEPVETFQNGACVLYGRADR